ncbi:MAG: GTP 3',8-cyclase MoaA [Syntrophomonadaceae bacterium]|nr:GTP 3',8-cyclase MoaA [Syntrophomonadaceae bacterium]
MVDRHGRNINYLRISITDRCNLRCRYCMPSAGVEKLPHVDILSLEEIARLVRIAAGAGIRKVRLTGGEPLVRKNVTRLIQYIKEIPEIDDISLTTNGILFSAMAEELKAAGLDRVNFSLDSLVPEKFEYITRVGNLDLVKNAIDRALSLDLHPVKINTVLIRGFNDNEIMDFADLAYKLPLHVRFIEFMPIGDLKYWNRDNIITSRETKNMIARRYQLAGAKKIRGSGPARYHKLEGGQGSVGFISPMSNHFCAECNRIRMTAEGSLRGCLYDKREVDLRQAMHHGASDEQLGQIFMETIKHKPDKHNMNNGWGAANHRKMYQIGG